jgi:histidine triad (HIT) family protein
MSEVSMVHRDADTMAFMDLRQFHPGHVLVIPLAHVPDIRTATDAQAASIMLVVARVARAVTAAFPGDGVSIWHSAGEGANQEVPHLHFHVHPRRIGDDVLRVYPAPPELPARGTLDAWAERVRVELHGSVTRVR